MKISNKTNNTGACNQLYMLRTKVRNLLQDIEMTNSKSFKDSLKYFNTNTKEYKHILMCLQELDTADTEILG